MGRAHGPPQGHRCRLGSQELGSGAHPQPHPPLPGQQEWGTRCPCGEVDPAPREYPSSRGPSRCPPPHSRTHLCVQAGRRRGVLAVVLDVQGHLLPRGGGVGALHAGVAAPRVLPHDAAVGGVPCKDGRGGKHSARPPAPRRARGRGVGEGAVPRSPPPASGSHAKRQRRVQGRRPRVLAASCWVPWGSDRLVLWGAGATLLRAPRAQRSPPHGGNPKSGSRERGCAPWPRPPFAHHLSAPHGVKSSGLQPSLGAGVIGGLSPSSRCSSFSCCFSPRALEEPGWVVPGGVQPATPLLSEPTWAASPSPRSSQKRWSPPSPSALWGASWHPMEPLPSPVAPPATHPPPPVTESSPQPVGAKLTWSHS